jgi:hypothetical protein
VLGAIAGLIWGAVAPRAMFQEVSPGAAQLVNPETTAFVVADVWFCGITAVGGLITGIAGTRLLVRGGNWPAAAGLVLGAVAAAFLALLIGQNIGLSMYNHQLATAASGTFFNSSLGLGAKSALAFWPLFTSAIIALTEGARRAQPDNSLPLAEGAETSLD